MDSDINEDVLSEENDSLYLAVKKYEQMLPVQYRIISAKKMKKTHVHIEFSKSDFKHLSGIQHLSDDKQISWIKGLKPVDFYEKCLNRNITYDLICFDEGFKKINLSKRIYPIRDIDYLIENMLAVFKYDNQLLIPRSFESKLNADYLIDGETRKSEKTFLFLKENKPKTKKDFPVSSPSSIFLLGDGTDYRKGQRKESIILWVLKRKINELNWNIVYKDSRCTESEPDLSFWNTEKMNVAKRKDESGRN